MNLCDGLACHKPPIELCEGLGHNKPPTKLCKGLGCHKFNVFPFILFVVVPNHYEALILFFPPIMSTIVKVFFCQ